MTDELAPFMHGAAWLARPDAGVLALEDADRVDFLQRMTTNNIAALRPGQAAVTVLTSPTARIVHVFTVLRRSDDLLLLPAPGEAAALERHLRGQIFFMDKVRVRNLSAAYAHLRVVGAQAAAVITQALGAAPGDDDAWLEQGGVIVLAQSRDAVPGFALVAPAQTLAAAVQALAAAGATPITPAHYDAWRVRLGRPAPGAELTADANPLEAGMAWACAADKGCYTGQEIIARQQTYEKVTRTLVGLRPAAPLAPGAPLTADGHAVGVVTSAAADADGRPIALAIVKRPHNQPGAHLHAGTVAGTVASTVVALPFA